MGRELYVGSALQAVDKKGRVAIPGDLRATLDALSDEPIFHLGKHPKLDCLIGQDIAYTLNHGEKIAQRLDRALDEGREIDPAAMRNLHGSLERTKYDDSARFVLSPYLRHRGQIGDWAFFIGSGFTFEVWAPELLLASDAVDEEFKERCRFSMAQRAGGAA